MLRTKLSKFKQVIAVAVIPRIFVRDIKPIKNKLHNYTLNVFNIAKKSTDSGSNDEEIEKRRQIIEKCFGEKPQSLESKDLKEDLSELEKDHKNIVLSDCVRLTDSEKSDTSKVSDNEPSHEASGMQVEEASVRATTANIAEETLEQKLETIEETPHVEASPQNIEGFNSTPKVLGHDIEFFADEKIQQIDLDDLAKRCVGAPIGNIDEMLIKEMKNMANNDNKIQPDMTLIKSHGVEKYYSGIFEHLGQQTKKPENVDDSPKEPLHLFYDNQIVGDNEMKSERITPLHIDAVHLFAFDEGSKDYKESGTFQDSSVYLSSEIIEEPLLDFPKIITPYENPAMPFYEYVNKEQIIVDDFAENETMTIAESAADAGSVADIPTAEEIFLRKENTDEPSFVIKKHEMDPVESEPNVSDTAKPILQSKEKKQNIVNEFGNLSREQLLHLLYLYNNPAVKNTDNSHVFSTTTDTPPIGINPSPNSSISGTYTPGVASKEEEESVDMPVNSAISANQNPGEYYNMSSLNEELVSNVGEELQTLTADNHIIHAFCTQLQDMEDGVSKETEDSVMILEYPYPFSYVLFEPEMKEKLVKDVLNEKLTATTKENVTDSVKNDATSVDDTIPLSQILKRIRDKNRLEFCRNLLLQNAKPDTSTKFTCIASLEGNKQKNSPRPCQPPPKPPKEKCPKPCPPPCPPKKDPCAKLIPFFLNTIIRFDVSCDIQFPLKQYNDIYYYKTMLTDDIIERLRKLGETLRFVKVDRDTNDVKDTTSAKDYEPWIPIPSWPAPRVEKKRPFICPKEGCKPAPVPRSNPPKQRPCLGVPKKSFSFSQVCLTPVNNPDIIFTNL